MTNVKTICKLWLPKWEVLIAVLLIMTAHLSSISSDPTNLVLNGDFETTILPNGAVWPQYDVSHDGDMNYIFDWQCVHGGVQILYAFEYTPDPAYLSVSPSLYLMHMNYKYGPGVLISSPIATPRKGATYNLTFSFADNPDGGPIFKTLRVKLLVNGEIAEPEIGDFNISCPESQRDTIQWSTMGAIFVGSGESTTFQFESLVEGSFGPLVDNIQATLLSVLENGSFEMTESLIVIDNNTWFYGIMAPSTVITSWTVVNGAVKWAGNPGTSRRWERSTDYSDHCLDLNGNETAGTIVSNPFPTVPGFNYVVLYDTAASPEGVQLVYGNLLATVKASVNGKFYASQTVIVNADGYSSMNIGWTTQTLKFTAPGTSAVVEFVSKIAGSNGPLLDNVYVYQVVPTRKFKSLPITYNAAETPPRPSMWWITALAGLCTLVGHRIGFPRNDGDCVKSLL